MTPRRRAELEAMPISDFCELPVDEIREYFRHVIPAASRRIAQVRASDDGDVIAFTACGTQLLLRAFNRWEHLIVLLAQQGAAP